MSTAGPFAASDPVATSTTRVSKRTRTALVALLIVGVAGAGLWYRHHQRYKHLATHEAGMVYRSAWLEPDVFAEVIEKHQIRAVVNLCAPGEMGEHRWDLERVAVRNSGAKLLELSMPLTVDPADPELATHMQALADPDNYPMLVHCQHGVTRTSKFLAMYDMLYRNMTAQQSLDAQPMWGRDDHNVNVRAFCLQFEQRHGALYPEQTAAQLEVLRR